MTQSIPWNSVRVDTRITPELISEANHAYTGNTDEFKNWYGDVSKVAHPLDVLLCQRSNLVWDWRLRGRYATAVSILTGTYLCLGALALYFLFRQPAREILVAWLLPSLSAFIEGTRLAIRHFAVAKDKQDLERIVASAWRDGLHEAATLTPTVLRQIQDRIYDLRIGAPPVPDWWNRWYRDRFETNMHEALTALQADAEAASRDASHASRA